MMPPRFRRLDTSRLRSMKFESVVGAPVEMRVADGSGKLGDLPLIVIRRGKKFSAKDAASIGMPAEQLEQSWKEAQERLAALSENSDLIVAESSEHGVPFTQPSLVADEIDRVVDAARRRRPVKDSRMLRQLKPPPARLSFPRAWDRCLSTSTRRRIQEDGRHLIVDPLATARSESYL